jgi:hypothetical protein
MTAVYVCLLLTLAIIASQWNIWLLHKRVMKLEARPEATEVTMRIIAAHLVDEFLADIEDDDADGDDDSAARSVN